MDSKDGMTNDSAKAGASNVNHLNDHKDQGLQSADVIIGGEKIKMDEEMSEKKKKKIARQEAKRKRDEMVSTMIKGTEQGLGAFADFMERMQKCVYIRLSNVQMWDLLSLQGELRLV